MDAAISHVVRQCSRASDENSESFPVIIRALTEAGIERYHADLGTGNPKSFKIAQLPGCRPRIFRLATSRQRSAPFSRARFRTTPSANASWPQAASAITYLSPASA